MYQACVDIFKILCRDSIQESAESLDSTTLRSRKPLQRQSEKFHLWGEGFGDGGLDKAVQESDDLKRTVLVLLCDVSRELLASKQFPLQIHTCISLHKAESKVYLAKSGEWNF